MNGHCLLSKLKNGAPAVSSVDISCATVGLQACCAIMQDADTTAAPPQPACCSRRLHVLERQLSPHQPAVTATQQQLLQGHPAAAAAAAAAAVQQAPQEQQSSNSNNGVVDSNSNNGVVDQQFPCSRAGLQRPTYLERFPPPCQHVCTLHDNWDQAVIRFPAIPALGWRSGSASGGMGPYQWLTYSEVGAARTAIGAGLLHLGVLPGSHIGIYSINCKEWVLLDAAAHAYSMVSVPLYDSLGPDAVQYIINHAELAAVGCSTALLPKLLACVPQCPTVKLLVVWDAVLQARTQAYRQSEPQSGTRSDTRPETDCGTVHGTSSDTRMHSQVSLQVLDNVTCHVVTLGQLESVGRAHPHQHVPPAASDVATICYTSGTTGIPKGAVLTHANLIANAAGCAAAMQSLAWVPGDKHLSFLPLAHIFERKNLTVSVHFGCSVGFYSGDARAVFQDAVVLQPDMFMAVPRVFNRLYDAVMTEIRAMNAAERWIFEAAYAYKAAVIKSGGVPGALLGGVCDKLLSSRVKQRLGGRVRYMTTGSSPISPQVLTFLRACFQADVLEGYGMTETSCTISIARQGDTTVGHVGEPLACCEVKLVDIPDMDYRTSETPYPRGEVCVRGPIVFQGYYKDPQQTAAALDADGWFHTGDVGQWLPGHRLQLIDRKKNLFKLAQGEYVSPEKLESIYARSPFVLQVFVHGDSTQHQLVAVTVPDPHVLLPWAREHGLPQDLAELCAHPAVVQAVLSSLVKQANEAQLQGYEVVAAAWLVPKPFDAESGLLTPTMKLRRHVARHHFRAALDTMYAQLQ